MADGAGDTILIVDDTPTNLQVLLNCLQSAGYRVLIATDGLQAIQRAELGNPDLILLDVLMPGIDGFETCKRLKLLPPVADIPVIFMTSLSDTREKIAGFDSGAIDYIVKPLEHQEVLARVRTHLTLRKLQSALEEKNRRLERTMSQLQTITDSLISFLRNGQLSEASQLLLDRAVTQSASEHGLLGMMIGAGQTAKVRILALSGKIGRGSKHTSQFGQIERAIKEHGYYDCRLDSLGDNINCMLATGFAVILNSEHDSTPNEFLASAGECHFLGVPVHQGGAVSGLIAVANRKDGYNRSEQIELEQLVQAAGVLIECERSHQREQLSVQQRERAEANMRYLQEEIKILHHFDEIVGSSKALRNVLEQIERVAQTDITVLIHGETGTGKELIARAVHDHSQRKDKPLITVNCAALPESLVESELFGHERGAFTGATGQRKGRFELADGGTLFLDEIGDMPIAAQTKLLRVLQEQQFERVGGSKTLDVDVRIIVATHRDLAARVSSGLFREDLYYRLNVFPIELPPLRARREDIAALARYFANRTATKIGRNIEDISSAALHQLLSYAWPGNVRELENVIERAVTLSSSDILEIPFTISPIKRDSTTAEPEQDILNVMPSESSDTAYTLDDVQRDYIIKTLNSTGWVIEGARGAASILGLKPSTLRNRMQRLGIKKPDAAQRL